MPYVETWSDRLLSWVDHAAVRRTMLLGLLGLSTVVLVLNLGLLRMPPSVTNTWPSHHAGDLERWHISLSKATRASPVATPAAVCDELRVVAAKYDEQLSGDGYLDVQALLDEYPGKPCAKIAKRLAKTLEDELHLIRGALVRASGKRGKVFEPMARDYRTLSAYTAIPGCWVIGGRRQCGNDAMRGLDDAKLAALLAAAGGDVRYELKGATGVAAGRDVPKGEDVAVTLEPGFQALSDRLAKCATGVLDQCQGLPPWVPRENTLRAGAIGLVVVEVESGRVVALSGAVSECVVENLGVRNTKRIPATAPSYPCASYPDAHLGWLAEHHSALWAAYPPGSTAKIGVFYGAFAAGLIDKHDIPKLTPVLAASHDLTGDGKHHQNLPREMALSLGGRKLADAYDALGYRTGGYGSDLFWGAKPDGNWFGPFARRPQNLEEIPGMAWSQFREIEALKQTHPAEADRKYPRALMERYLGARTVADAAIGGGDMQVSAFGLAEVMRQLALAQSGKTRAPRTHLLESRSRKIENQKVRLAPAAARNTLRLLSHVADPKLSGTAAVACTRIGGQACRDVIGKTGTSDFLVSEDGRGGCEPKLLRTTPNEGDQTLQVPGKLFVGLVPGASGSPRYVVAATALRTAVPGRCLDSRNAAAEAAMVMVRVLREGASSQN